MRPYALNTATGSTEKLSPDQPAPTSANVKLQFLPRIRCNDCPGKLYTAAPGLVEQQFSLHLRNRGHKEKVAERERGKGR